MLACRKITSDGEISRISQF